MGKGGKWAKMGHPGNRQRRRHGRALLRPKKRVYRGRGTSRERRAEARRYARLTEQVAWGLGEPSKSLRAWRQQSRWQPPPNAKPGSWTNSTTAKSSEVWGTIWTAACLLWLPAYIVYKIIYR